MKIFNKEKVLKLRIKGPLFLVSFALVFGGVLWTYFSLGGASGPVIIHFDSLTGISLIGSFWSLVGFGIMALIIVTFNFLIAFELRERDRFLARLAAVVTLLFAVLIFIALAAIISVN